MTRTDQIRTFALAMFLLFSGCTFQLIEDPSDVNPGAKVDMPTAIKANSIGEIEGYWTGTDWFSGVDAMYRIDQEGVVYDVYPTGFEKSFGQWWFEDGNLHVISDPMDPLHSMEQPEGTYVVSIEHAAGAPDRLVFTVIEDEMTIRVSALTSEVWRRAEPPDR